jgi:hypothetical protein
MVAGTEEILHHHGLTRESYSKMTFMVSTDSALHRMFDSVLVVATGAPLASQQRPVRGGAGGGAAAQVRVPEGPAGTHIGHVVNSFGDTPNMMGLLPAALAEANTAAQHATLGARTPDNLDMMKLHAGHVLHALDPSVVTQGPGLGYGVKKAALAAASHIELAAQAQGASPNIVTHSVHIATAARGAAKRADDAIAIAKQIQAATSAADAAALMGKLVSLTAQIGSGFDANADGTTGWQAEEGGLQQAQQHITLMLNAEGLGG